jgi:flagellar motor switch protein FliG
MGNIKIVLTADGHDKTIDKISVSLFEASDADTYCNTINSFELKDDKWVIAKTVDENKQYGLSAFFPVRFSDVILRLYDRSIQKVLREVDSQELVKALKDQDLSVQEKIFNNMSKRAAHMLKEDMTNMRPVTLIEVKETQEKILRIIQILEQRGEIIIPNYKGEIVE